MASPSSTTATKSKVFTSNISNYNDFGYVMQANNIYNRSDIQWYSKFNISSSRGINQRIIRK